MPFFSYYYSLPLSQNQEKAVESGMMVIHLMRVEDLGTGSLCSLDAGTATCRVWQCAESDKRGDAALGFWALFPP
ncbi:hypothetical protein NC653_012487 [Populus alba x Populus x berolinensis]|uniref:Uncharacterized protein n=1 Tax=Populus alba x Populus x berolinensis TaxID=444605 RepID=A0AAD6QS88_9ROSI|nr:hypothetical protein NC653_012487 [Populus alba x Populus x berolinensis]